MAIRRSSMAKQISKSPRLRVKKPRLKSKLKKVRVRKIRVKK
jgi:hypothetical protein